MALSEFGQVIRIQWNNYMSPGFIEVVYAEIAISRIIHYYGLNKNEISDGAVYTEEPPGGRVYEGLYVFTQAREDVRKWANKLFTFPRWSPSEEWRYLKHERTINTNFEAIFHSGFDIPEIPGIEHAKPLEVDRRLTTSYSPK